MKYTTAPPKPDVELRDFKMIECSFFVIFRGKIGDGLGKHRSLKKGKRISLHQCNILRCDIFNKYELILESYYTRWHIYGLDESTRLKILLLFGYKL